MRKFDYWLTTVASVASIIGLLVILFLDPMKATLALVAILVVMGAVLWKAYRVLNLYLLAVHPKGHSSVATLQRYSTEDGTKIRFETYKYIQCRQLVMSNYPYQFNWTGTQRPRITSHFQQVRETTPGSAGEYDRVYLDFKSPLRFNDSTVIHVSMELDDSDRRSKTHLETKVMEPLQLLQWRVELRYVNARYAKTARVMKQAIDTIVAPQPVQIGSVAFDKVSKSYEYHIVNPEPGYYYRLEWDR